MRPINQVCVLYGRLTGARLLCDVQDAGIYEPPANRHSLQNDKFTYTNQQLLYVVGLLF